MMGDNALMATTDTSIIESVMMKGDLGKLTPQERMSYYSAVCESMGLNPLTRPFDYINLNGKLTLYAKRDAADQLRKIHGISIDRPSIEFTDDLVIVSVTGRDKTGRTDSDLGVVHLGKKTGDPKANAILKAITKAKRRLTLSIVGLGWLDETEVDTIPGVRHEYPPEHRALIDESAERAEAERAARELGFEDGIGGNAKSTDPEPSAPQRKGWPSGIVSAIIDAHLAANVPNTTGMLNLSKVIEPTDTKERIMTWAALYRSARGEMEPNEAAATTDTALREQEEESN